MVALVTHIKHRVASKTNVASITPTATDLESAFDQVMSTCSLTLDDIVVVAGFYSNRRFWQLPASITESLLDLASNSSSSSCSSSQTTNMPSSQSKSIHESITVNEELVLVDKLLPRELTVIEAAKECGVLAVKSLAIAQQTKRAVEVTRCYLIRCLAIELSCIVV